MNDKKLPLLVLLIFHSIGMPISAILVAAALTILAHLGFRMGRRVRFFCDPNERYTLSQGFHCGNTDCFHRIFSVVLHQHVVFLE